MAHQCYMTVSMLVIASAAFAVSTANDDPEVKAIDELQKLGATVLFTNPVAKPTDEPRDGAPQVSFVVVDQNWKGGDEGLDHVERLPKLSKLLIVGHPKISEERLAKLKKTMPKLSVEPRPKAMLGIALSTAIGVEGVVIGQVKENSAASKGGLMVGDAIQKLDGKKIGSFVDVVNILSNREPGDEVDVVVIRNEKSMTLKVKLEKWY